MRQALNVKPPRLWGERGGELGESNGALQGASRQKECHPMTFELFSQLSSECQENAGAYGQDNDIGPQSHDEAPKAPESASGAGDPKPGDKPKGKKPKATEQRRREACGRGTHEELLRHALYRLGDSAKPLNCYRFAYCWATVARMFPPGRHRVMLWHEGVALRGDYYWAWPETSVDGLLADAARTARRSSRGCSRPSRRDLPR